MSNDGIGKLIWQFFYSEDHPHHLCNPSDRSTDGIRRFPTDPLMSRTPAACPSWLSLPDVIHGVILGYTSFADRSRARGLCRQFAQSAIFLWRFRRPRTGTTVWIRRTLLERHEVYCMFQPRSNPFVSYIDAWIPVEFIGAIIRPEGILRWIVKDSLQSDDVHLFFDIPDQELYHRAIRCTPPPPMEACALCSWSHVHDGSRIDTTAVRIGGRLPFIPWDVGDDVDAMDHDGHWWRARVVARHGDTVRIHFLGWMDSWDLILPRDSPMILPRGVMSERITVWYQNLGVRDFIELRVGIQWYPARIRRISYSTGYATVKILRAQVYLDLPLWAGEMPECVCPPGTHVRPWVARPQIIRWPAPIASHDPSVYMLISKRGFHYSYRLVHDTSTPSPPPTAHLVWSMNDR